MFSHIRTSKENKEVITQLTNKLNLGAENVIARIALAFSLAQDEKLDLSNLKDSGGKEYSKNVLLGNQNEIYLGILCSKYNLHSSDQDLHKYLKLHLDRGLEKINSKLASDNLQYEEFILSIVHL
jgi:DNA sulfur modification protein DndE